MSTPAAEASGPEVVIVEDERNLRELYLDVLSEEVLGFYDRDDKSIYVIADKEQLSPGDSVTLAHEFTHALINVYNLPVLGKEEDAADTLATLLLLKAPNGDKLALGAAEFWADFSGRQNPPAIADYADAHSLDLQRAYSIVCDIAGSNQQRYDEINQAGILPDGDIKSCPAQYQQDVKSFTQVLQPHVNGTLNFRAPSN